MAKQYETDPNTHVLTPKGRRERNADRTAATKTATDLANAAREAAPDVSGQGTWYVTPAPEVGVRTRYPEVHEADMVLDQADAKTAGFNTVNEWEEAGRPK